MQTPLDTVIILDKQVNAWFFGLRDIFAEKIFLSFTMLGEASTIKIAKKKEALGFIENKDAAKRGGTVAGVARSELEKESGEKVVSKENYLSLSEKNRRKLIKSK